MENKKPFAFTSLDIVFVAATAVTWILVLFCSCKRDGTLTLISAALCKSSLTHKHVTHSYSEISDCISKMSLFAPNSSQFSCLLHRVTVTQQQHVHWSVESCEATCSRAEAARNRKSCSLETLAVPQLTSSMLLWNRSQTAHKPLCSRLTFQSQVLCSSWRAERGRGWRIEHA